MALYPNRISAFQPMSPQREGALARQLLEVQSEEELDHFLPLLAAALPMITNIAGPLLKNVAGSLLGGGGPAKKRKRPRDEQEQFLGKIFKGVFGGELEAESAQQEQFLGGIVKGLLGGEMESEQQERFLGGIIGKLFGGGELEAESYAQEQFLGGIVKGLLGGEMESETSAPAAPGPAGHPHLLRRARRFVRLVDGAAGHAAAHLSHLQSLGHRPSPAELRRIVLTSIVKSARRFAPRMAAIAFPGGDAAGAEPPATRGGRTQGQTMLEVMMADATPLGAGTRSRRPPNGSSNGYPLG